MDLPKLKSIDFESLKKYTTNPFENTIENDFKNQKTSLKLWPDQTEEKARRVKAEGDFSVNTSALRKKYNEVLMGRGPSDGVERREIEFETESQDQTLHLNENQLKLSNDIRKKLMNKAKVVAKSAMKMDGDADLDAEGYRNITSDDQAFRIAQSKETKRVKFPLLNQTRQNEGVLKPTNNLEPVIHKPSIQPEIILSSKHDESKRSNAPLVPQVTHFAKDARGKDLIHENISKRDDLSLEIGKLFLKIVGTEIDLVPNTKSNIISEESRRNGQVLILKQIEKIKLPTSETMNETREKVVEESTRDEVELLASHLGKVFIDIGLTLPSGNTVEQAKKNDLIAYTIGSKAIQNCDSGTGGAVSSTFTVKSDSQKSYKSELIAVAMGRILMHLRGASQVLFAKMDAPTVDQTLKNQDKSILALGRLTLQMIEQSAMSNHVSGKIGFESRKHTEGFIRNLGLAVYKSASSLSATSHKPFFEEARKQYLNSTIKQTSKFIGSGTEQTASSSNTFVNDSLKQDSLKLKQSSNIQSINVQVNEPTNLSLKQPLGESKELILNKTPSIDILPSKQRTSMKSNKILKTNIVLPERISNFHENDQQNQQNQQNCIKEDSLEKYSRQKKVSKLDHTTTIEEQKQVLKYKSKSTVKDLFDMSTIENNNEEIKQIENEPQKSVWKQKKFLG
jgi:hypothetical protein